MTPKEQERFEEGVRAGLGAALSVAADGYAHDATLGAVTGVLHKILISPQAAEIIAKYLTPENLALREGDAEGLIHELMHLIDPKLRAAVAAARKELS